MKTVFVSIAVVVAIAIGVGTVYFVNDARGQDAMVNVFSEQSKAAVDLKNELHERRSLSQTQRDLREFAQAVQAIDTSSCPKDFRLAWFDYASAVTDLSRKNLEASAIKDAVELEASVWMKDGKLAEDAMQDADSPNRVAQCFRRCQRIAISHGLSFHPVVNQQQN